MKISDYWKKIKKLTTLQLAALFIILIMVLSAVAGFMLLVFGA